MRYSVVSFFLAFAFACGQVASASPKLCKEISRSMPSKIGEFSHVGTQLSDDGKTHFISYESRIGGRLSFFVEDFRSRNPRNEPAQNLLNREIFGIEEFYRQQNLTLKRSPNAFIVQGADGKPIAFKWTIGPVEDYVLVGKNQSCFQKVRLTSGRMSKRKLAKIWNAAF